VSGGGSLFDVAEESPAATAPNPSAQEAEAKPEVTDTGADNEQHVAPAEAKPERSRADGGARCDTAADQPPAPAAKSDDRPEPNPSEEEAEAKPEVTDTGADNEQHAVPAEEKPEASVADEGDGEIKSLFDIKAEHSEKGSTGGSDTGSAAAGDADTAEPNPSPEEAAA